MKTTCIRRAGWRWAIVLGSVGLTSCDKSNIPGPAYRLTADELAWQGYQQGQQLRFGRAGSAQVRTYLITEVSDRLEPQYQSFWITSLQGQPPTYQHITVKGYRTDSTIYNVGSIANPRDSVRAVETFLDLHKYEPRGMSGVRVLLSQLGWDHWFRADPLLENVTTNQPIPAGSKVVLLPTSTLGAVSYGPTLQIDRVYAVSPTPRQRVINRVYYAKGKGVVGYEEQGTGLWYRLP
jgi:hypothetical protein